MPYDEIAYQRIEEEGEKNSKQLEKNGKIRRLLRNENFEMCLCLTLSFLILGISFHFGGIN
jgi:hypothetical protein